MAKEAHMKYRGYYIDHVVLDSKEEIDRFVKEQGIKNLKRLNGIMHTYTDSGMIMTACNEACRVERFLHDECGMAWDEIEALEVA